MYVYSILYYIIYFIFLIMYIDCLQAVDGKVHFVYKKESAIHSFFYFISFSFISQIYEYIININLFAPFYSKYWIFYILNMLY